MKICPNCHAVFADDTLRFCLQCGNVLADQALNAQLNQGGSGKLIAVVLSCFAVLVLIVGGLGGYFFSRQTERETNGVLENTNQTNETAATGSLNDLVNRRQTAAVERLDNKNQVVAADNPGKSKTPNQVQTTAQTIASASSVRLPDDNNFYFPNFAFDKNPATAWCEGADGAGKGEWLQFDFGAPVSLKEIKIMPGYFKNADAWRKNNRAAAVALKFSDGTTRANIRLADKMETQTISVGSVLTNSVKITVDEVYTGSADDKDTLISEISFVTEP